jgi:outer membrane protein
VLLSVALCLLSAGVVAAQERPPAAESGLSLSLGAGVIAKPRPYVGADSEVQAIPIVSLRSQRFSIEGIRAGYRLLGGEAGGLDLRLRFQFSGLDPDDSPFLAGMEERDETVEAGLGFSLDLGRGLELEVAATADILGRSNGAEGSVDLGWRRVWGRGRVILVPAVGVVYQTANQVSHFAGVRADEARPGRPAYDGRSAVNPRASILLVNRLAPRWFLTTLMSYQLFDDGITASPIIDRSGELFGLVGLSYRVKG